MPKATVSVFREGDRVRHREFQNDYVGEIIHVMGAQADVMWPWSSGPQDAGTHDIKDLVKA